MSQAVDRSPLLSRTRNLSVRKRAQGRAADVIHEQSTILHHISNLQPNCCEQVLQLWAEDGILDQETREAIVSGKSAAQEQAEAERKKGKTEQKERKPVPVFVYDETDKPYHLLPAGLMMDAVDVR